MGTFHALKDNAPPFVRMAARVGERGGIIIIGFNPINRCAYTTTACFESGKA